MKQETQNTQSNLFHFPRLTEYAVAIGRIIRELSDIGASPGEIIGLLKGTPGPPGSDSVGNAETEADAGIGMDIPDAVAATVKPARPMFTAQKIARALGIYSMYGLPHAHAVSAILNDNIFIEDEHKEERVLFRTREFTIYYTLYDGYAAAAIRDWLESREYPYEVDSYYYTYHIRYVK